METTAEKLDILTGIIARKDLSFGCYIKDPANQVSIITTVDKMGFNTLYISGTNGIIDLSSPSEGRVHKDAVAEIIGHPVLLSDVLVWGKDKIGGSGFAEGNLEIWDKEYEDSKWLFEGHRFLIPRDLTKPYLSEQGQSVIDGLYEVYNLIK